MSLDYTRLERNLAREFRQYHVTALIRNAIIAFLGALALQLKDGWTDWTWKGLWSLGVAAAVGAAQHFAPQVPWKLFLGHVQVAQAVAANKDAQSAVQAAVQDVPAPTAEQVYTPVTPPADPPAPAPPPAAK